MKKNRTIFALMLVFALLSTVVSGCGGSAGQETPTTGDIFVIARATDASTLDCGYAYDEGEIDLMYHIYDGLVQFKNSNLEVEPALAESWTPSEDGTVWIFNLRQDVKFHDGTDFNADAVVFSFKRLIDENHPYYGMGDYSYFDWLLADAIKDVKAVDEYTVEISLNDKFAPFLTYLGYYSEFIVSPTAVKKYGQDFFKNPVGTGPFKFTEWKKDEYIKLSANEDYWDEKPEINTLIWKVVPDDSTRLMELESGQVQAIKHISPNQLDKIKSNDQLVLKQCAGANIFFASFNTEKKPFNDLRVRQAVNYAIDMDKLVNSSYEGLATRAVNPMPPTIFGFNNDVKAYPYDPEKAKELLAEAGYPNGLNIELNVFSEARPYVSRPIDVAQIIKSDLSKAGINCKLTMNEWGTHSSIMNNMEHEFAFNGWYDIPYPNNFLKAMVINGSNTGYAPDKIVELANKALATYNKDEQIEYYKEMQAIIHEDAPILPIAHSDYTAVVAGNIEGFDLDVLGNVHMQKAHYK